MNARDLAHIALFAAVTAALGIVPPISVAALGAVPITAQSLGPMLAGSVLGARKGAASQALFVLVALYLPLLSGARTGIYALGSPTGGFFIAFIPAAFVIGLITQAVWSRYSLIWAVIANITGGLVVIYLIGIPYMAAMSENLTLGKAITAGVTFLPGDLIKVAIASVAAVTVARAYPLIQGRPGPAPRAGTGTADASAESTAPTT